MGVGVGLGAGTRAGVEVGVRLGVGVGVGVEAGAGEGEEKGNLTYWILSFFYWGLLKKDWLNSPFGFCSYTCSPFLNIEENKFFET